MINALSIIPCKTDSCPTMGDYAIKKKMNVKWGKHKVGDIVLFDFNRNGTSDHIGIVIGIDGSKIITIEGNTGSGNDTNGGQVQKRTRTKSQVNYFVRPKYTKTITPAMVIDTAKAELGVKEKPKNSNKVKYNQWFYGKNVSAYWCCTFVCWVFAHVKGEEVIPTVSKPTGKYSGTIPSHALKKGSKGKTVGQWQKFLNWYHPAWKLKVDDDFGAKTEKATKSFQKTEGIKPDGETGPITYGKAKAYKAPAKTTPKTSKTTAKTTNADKLVKKMDELAWAYGTAKKKYAYKTGKPKDACKKAMAKYGYKSRINQSDCGMFVNTVVREAGIDKKFESLKKTKGGKFVSPGKNFTIVFQGKAIPNGLLKPGDIIRYKKKSGQHAMFYYGNGRVCDAGRGNRFANIRKDEKRYAGSKVKKNTIQVLRAK